MKVAKIKGYPVETIKLPKRGTAGSAGLDFFCPCNSPFFLERLKEINPEHRYTQDGDEIIISPGERILIPSGLKVNVPEGLALVGFEKSGLATKHGVTPTCRVVDEDYQGELCIGIINHSKACYSVKFGEKIGQYVLLPVVKEDVELVEESDLYTETSERGDGGFGSTGMK